MQYFMSAQQKREVTLGETLRETYQILEHHGHWHRLSGGKLQIAAADPYGAEPWVEIGHWTWAELLTWLGY